MPKVTLIGAGSAVFKAEIMKDILTTPALEGGIFTLVDTDERVSAQQAYLPSFLTHG